MNTPLEQDNGMDAIALGFAARLILSEMDERVMAECSLEGVADFSGCKRLALFRVFPMDSKIKACGLRVEEVFTTPEFSEDLGQTPLGNVAESRRPALFPLDYKDGMPWPADGDDGGRGACLAVPLLAAENQVSGVLTMELEPGQTMDSVLTPIFNTLLAVVAIGLAMERLFQMAVRDELTGLFVRRYFNHRLSEEAARIKRYGGSVSLLVADIDHFKKFNDTYGHQQGDLVLRETARLLQEAVRTDVDVVCRYGGEEFVLILPHTDEEGAMVVAERVRSMVEEHPFSGQDEPLGVTVSLGAASMSKDALLAGDKLFSRADAALYKAKNGGRNRVVAWTGDD